APLPSLPGIFRTNLETIPAKVPYLAAYPRLMEQWRQALAPYSGFKIGIAWQGNPGFQGDPFRSIPLTHFARLARVEGVCLINLQKGPGSEQLRAVADDFRVIDLGNDLDTRSGAFMIA